MIDKTIYALLTLNVGVSALVGTRVYPVRLPQSPTLPAVSYQEISQQRGAVFGGVDTLPGKLYQIDSWAKDDDGTGHLQAKTLADAVRHAMDAYAGTPAGGDLVQALELENERDEYDPDVKIARVLQEYRIWAVES